MSRIKLRIVLNITNIVNNMNYRKLNMFILFNYLDCSVD